MKSQTESCSDTRVLVSRCRIQITPIEINDIYSCPVATKWSLLSTFLSGAVAARSGRVKNVRACNLCSLFKNI